MRECIGVIGVGHLARHLVQGLRRARPEVGVVLSPRNRTISAQLANARTVRVAENNQEVADACDTVLLATPRSRMLEVVDQITWRGDHVVISLTAALPLTRLAHATAPAEVVRALPSIAAAVGESATVMYPDNERARVLFSLVGAVEAVPDEAMFEAATVIGTCVCSLVALTGEMVGAAQEAGVAPQVARALVGQTVRGVGALALESRQSLENVAGGLAIPGSFSLELLNRLRESGGFSAWRAGIGEIAERKRATFVGGSGS